MMDEYIDVATRATKALLLEIMFLGQQEVLGFSGGIFEMINPLIILLNIGDRNFHFNAILIVLIPG